MRTVHDQLGRAVAIASAQRIVSLCPSTTETLFALGVGARVVGRTDYCVHPAPDVAAVTSVGGTKNVRPERLQALAPDLVLAVREENDREQVEAIAARWPTVVFDAVDVTGAIAGIELLGLAVDANAAARELAADVRRAFARLPDFGGRPALYLIWRKPYMCAGAGTYVDDVLQRLGLRNVARACSGRYPAIDDPHALQPELVLAASEPFPFAPGHLPELREAFPRARIELVDGEMFSWHGARMRVAADYFATLRAD